ncbi:transposase [Paraburkholderia sp. ZP32-5]|uniref:transposase n=1 Tax=Paraburkholderia sp. ZP32-5 TaxID=2883245 RepID=UPI001F235BCF|nr:transposase [Paraburkholderia sp. ZP32-5]
MKPYSDITDEQWRRVAPLLPELRPRAELRGRPLANTRAVLNGVLWVMYNGATWSALPSEYPSYQTCHRRFKLWHKAGVLAHVTRQLLGASSEELCGLMESRMRRHVSAKQKRAAAKRGRRVVRVPSGVCKPVAGASQASSLVALVESVKQAA